MGLWRGSWDGERTAGEDPGCVADDLHHGADEDRGEVPGPVAEELVAMREGGYGEEHDGENGEGEGGRVAGATVSELLLLGLRDQRQTRI